MYPGDQTYVNSVSTMLSSSSNNLGDNNYTVNNMFEGYGDLASEMVYGMGEVCIITELAQLKVAAGEM